MSNTKNPREFMLASLEAEKNKATAAKKPHWAKLIAYVKKHDLPSGQVMWTYGKEVRAGGSDEFAEAVIEHDKEAKGYDPPVAYGNSTQANLGSTDDPLSLPSRQVPANEIPTSEVRNQRAQWSSWTATGSHHNIDVLLRVNPNSGGDPLRVLHYRPMNDTGSDIQTIYQPDFNYLNQGVINIKGFGHLTVGGQVHTAHTTITVQQTALQIAVVALTGDADFPYRFLMDWKHQNCVIMPPGASCLSGDKMREHLWFCTPRGNQRLYVAENKTTLLRNMPANLT